MDTKFSKLRFDQFAKGAAAAAIVGAMAMHTGAANANDAKTHRNSPTATGSIAVHAGNAVWYLNTNITFSTTSSNWGFSEASLHTAAGTRTDAYDGALSWLVSTGTPGSADGYRSPGGVVDISPNNPPTNPAVPTTVTGTTQVLAGLNVSGQVYFPVNKAVVRSILNLQNPTGADITVNVESTNNLGSDSNTVIDATSSGDNPFNYANDHWFVSSQGNPLIPKDPVLTFALSMAGAPTQAVGVQGPTNGKDTPYWEYTITVPAGQTRSLMVFSQLSDTIADAQTDAAAFNSNASLQASGYLAGLTPTQQGQIVNWTLSSTTAPVPTLGRWTMLLLSGLVAIFGLTRFKFLWRRFSRTT
ncbi:MAG: IPTL-CTERM sorting domain-containing protein [Rudaea sp.]